MNRLLIARHGNTFQAGQSPIRIGVQTDLPLVESGSAQAQALGKFLKNFYPDLAAVYTGRLKRAQETARIALETAQFPLKIEMLAVFDEIDYGVDEGKTEAQIVARIGQTALRQWDSEGKVPAGWNVQPEAIIQSWHDFAKTITRQHANQTVLVVTSQGIARFAPHLTAAMDSFKQKWALKVSTGAVCSLVETNSHWAVEYWNKKP